MTRDEQAKEKMQEVARLVSAKLPPGMGFILLAFDFGPGENRRLNYVSNANREDVVKAMEEWISRTKKTYGKHVPDDEWIDWSKLRTTQHHVNDKFWCINQEDLSDFMTTFGSIWETNKRGYDWSNYKFRKLD